MDIYVVEGPAGSGKSTLIEKYAAETSKAALVLKPRPFEGIRNYGGLLGLQASLNKDVSIIGSLLTSEEPIVFVDRWILSSFVYDTLRGEAPAIDTKGFHLTMASWGVVWWTLQNILQQRGRLTLQNYRIHWKFIIPDELELIRRRRGGGKGYPFQAHLEITEYMRMYYLLGNKIATNPIRIPHNISMTYQDVTKEEWRW